MGPIFSAMLVLGLIQGIAEFLPVSSSGHLVLFENIPCFREILSTTAGESGLFINVALHVATLIGIIIYLRRDIIKISSGVFKELADKNLRGGDIKTVRNIAIASIPAGIAGILLHDIFESVFSSANIVFFMLIINGFILISTKKIPLKSRKLEEIGVMNAFLIGIFQAVAIIPGISRSGMTITGGMVSGLKPEESARFSFLMAIPVIAGAGLLEGLKAAKAGFSAEIIFPLLTAMVFTVIVSLFSLRALFVIVKKVRLDLFGYYTSIVGILGAVIYYMF